MATPFATAIGVSWRRNGAYGGRLVGDLTDAHMTAQPVAGVTMNHPAWILSHLNVYAPIAAAMLRGQPFDDPADHRYGAKSRCVNDPAEYATRARLVEDYARLHADVAGALESAPPEVFTRPTPLERWREMHPVVGDMLVTLIVKHESTHLGQLSAWRRAMRLPPVAV